MEERVGFEPTEQATNSPYDFQDRCIQPLCHLSKVSDSIREPRTGQEVEDLKELLIVLHELPQVLVQAHKLDQT